MRLDLSLLFFLFLIFVNSLNSMEKKAESAIIFLGNIYFNDIIIEKIVKYVGGIEANGYEHEIRAIKNLINLSRVCKKFNMLTKDSMNKRYICLQNITDTLDEKAFLYSS